MRPEDLAWVAGLLEGEGSFMIRTNGTPKIQCQMTDEDVILKLQAMCGGNVYFSERTVEQKEKKWKDTWSWIIQGKDASDLMKLLLPLMGERRSQKIRDVLNAYSSHKDRVDRERNERVDRYIKIAKEYIETDLTYKTAKEKYNITAPTLAKYVTIVRQQAPIAEMVLAPDS